jgi:uncharacterized SAM-binding protein YcdF (DUF218 family)
VNGDDPAGVPAADAIVVLGAAVHAGGRPSPALRRRTAHAVALYRAGVADCLILTGGTGRYSPTEAVVMQQLAVADGVPPARLILEETAADTLANARACAVILKQRGWRRVVVVTDRYHWLRARLAFRHYGIAASASVPPRPCIGIRDCIPWLRELAALPWYLLRMAGEWLQGNIE